MTAYTLFGQTGGSGSASGSATVTLGTEFEVSTSIPLTGIWFNSPSGAVSLPNACAIYDQAAGTVVTGTLTSTPSWSGAAGSGWVKCTYSGSVNLVSGKKYYTCVFNNAGSLWYGSTAGYFTTGAGSAGISNPPLSAPNNSSSANGQGVAASGPGSISLPTINEAGKSYFVDVEVTPSATPVTLADTGGAADVLTVAVTSALADAGASAEWSYADGPRTDSGGVADRLTASVTLTLADTAGAADAPAVSVPVAFPDTAAAADTASASGNVALGDTAGAAEASVVTAGTALADAGAALDWLAADGMRQEQAAAADTAAVAAAVSVTETAGAADTVAAVAGTGLPDSAAAADTLTAGAVLPAPDSAGAADTMAAEATAGLPETSAAADILAVTITEPVTVPDAAGAAETLTTAVTVLVQDAAGGAPAFAGEPVSTGYAAWTVSPLAARWHATPMPPRWKAVLMNFAPIAAVSLEEISVLWNSMFAGTELDPTGQTAGQPQLPVQFAFPVSSGNPLAPAEPVDWFDGVWLTGTNIRGYVAQCLTGPGGGVVTLTASTAYDVWGKIAGATETPCKFAGTQAVY